MEIKYCGSSTVTNNEQKHSQNVMATIFSSGCYAPYIYTIIATPLHFLRLPLSSIFCFFVALGPSTYRPLQNLSLQLHVDVDYPVLIPSRTMAACKCLVREIEVIMRVRVRLCTYV